MQIAVRGIMKAVAFHLKRPWTILIYKTHCKPDRLKSINNKLAYIWEQPFLQILQTRK